LEQALKIDSQKAQSQIVDFMRSTLKERDIEGLVILYKDCIESLINCKLAAQTIGWENVKLIVPRGRFSTDTTTRSSDLQTIKKYLEISNDNIVLVNIEQALAAINNLTFEKTKTAYGSTTLGSNPLYNYNLSYYLLRGMTHSEIEETTFTAPSRKPKTDREIYHQKTIAHYKSKIRLHMLLGFLVAESENKSFLGSVNKTEWLLGLFTKFGTYQAADFLPLANLYRTQTVQFGEFLELGEYLASKKRETPTSYKYLFDLSYQEVDRVLIRLETGMSIDSIHDETSISKTSIEKIVKNHAGSNYARCVPLIPKIK
jgi:NAD+ synthase